MAASNDQAAEPAHDFLWGSATSAYQFEGGNEWSDWAGWEKKLGWQPCDSAVDHYHRFAEDFALAKSLNQNAHRLSLEWARLEPAAGKYSPEALAHYKSVLAELKKLGLAVFLTLHHFTIPKWLADKGGWENPQVFEHFGRYVALVVKELGSWVDAWLTINEPLVLATEGYWFGHWPPLVRSHQRMVKVLKNLATAHNQAYELIHKIRPEATVGLAHNFFSLEPRRSWFWPDRLAVHRADKFWNHWLLDLTREHHDFLGVNYYFHQHAYFTLNPWRGFIGFADPKKLGKEVSSLGWEINPEGLRELLLKLWREYRLPIYVTENGLAPQSDEQQIRFMLRSVKALAEARQAGANVKGYFYWSLLDNFEWNKGYTPHFGLAAVDLGTFERRPKPAANVYAKLCQAGAPTLDSVSKLTGGVHL